MDKKKVFKLFVSLAITLGLVVIFLSLSKSKTYQILELKALDLRFSLRSTQPIKAPVIHIDIDDQSLDKLGRWPWPRSYHAKLVDILSECGAKQVLFDVLFMEEFKDNPQEDKLFAASMSRSNITYLPFYFVEGQTPPSPRLEALLLKDITISVEDAAEALKIKPELLRDNMAAAKRYVMDEAVRGLLREKPDMSEDELFEAIEETKGWFLFPAEEDYIRGNLQNLKLVRFFVDKFALDCPKQGWPFKKSYKNLTPPIREYLNNMKNSGFINADPDLDGVTRRVPLFIKYEDKILPQLAVAALMDSFGVKEIEIGNHLIILKNAFVQGIQNDIRIPVDQTGCMFVNWSGKWGSSFAHVPYYLVLRLQEVREDLRNELSDADADKDKDSGKIKYLKDAEIELKSKLTGLVKDKICIVGLTGTGTHDLRAIPLQASYPMVGAHSNLVNTIVTGNFIRHGGWLFQGILFLFTALFIGFSSLVRLWKSILIAFCYALGYFIMAFLVFDKMGLWIDLVGPQGITIFGFAGITAFRYFTEEREKVWIKHAFSHYLSPQVINEMVEDPSRLKLGGERKSLTVLFSDVRGFTTFSESHQPEEVVAILNELLTEQVKVVFKYYGTLDKFVGDELMAFFGAPGNIHKDDHALVAVRTAIDIQSKLREIQEKWSREGKESLQIGIGINTGDMVVGNMGSSERMDYTVIGDNVNLGARLCSAAKAGEIIISQATYEQVKDKIEVEKLEPISVKGKSQPISIYRVLGLK